MISLQTFLIDVNGKRVNTDGADAGQCTAVPHLWEQDNSWPVVLGNAKDTLGNASSSFYAKVANTPTNFPPPGAVIVWGSTWGEGYGHTAVVVAANANLFTCIEQNDGDNGLAHEGTHNYGGIIGWFFPLSAQVNSGPVTEGGPQVVEIKEIVNVRTEPSTAGAVVAQLHVGTCQVQKIIQGETATVGTHSSDMWGLTEGGHYFSMAATM